MIFGDYLPALVAAAISILLFSLLLFRIVFYYDIDIYLLNKEEGYSDSVQQYGTTHIWLITKFMAFCDLSKDRNENENLLLVFRTGGGTSSSLSSWLSSSSYSNSSSSLQQTQLLLQNQTCYYEVWFVIRKHDFYDNLRFLAITERDDAAMVSFLCHIPMKNWLLT